MKNKLNCPGCSSPMEKVTNPDFNVDRCENCLGVWFDRGELNAMATGLAGDIEYCSRLVSTQDDDNCPDRKCPICVSKTMKKTDLLAFGDTVFDCCVGCGGFFLDHGEVKKMNAQLTTLSKTNGGEEYREYHDQNLVVLDRIQDVFYSGNLAGLVETTDKVVKIRLSIFFQNPLPFQIRVTSEKWTHKLAKAFHLFWGEDIQVGDPDIDTQFLIEGDNAKDISKLLTRREVKSALAHFFNSKSKILKKQGQLEILKDRLIYSEGPYVEATGVEVVKDSKNIIDDLLTLARALSA